MNHFAPKLYILGSDGGKQAYNVYINFLGFILYDLHFETTKYQIICKTFVCIK